MRAGTASVESQVVGGGDAIDHHTEISFAARRRLLRADRDDWLSRKAVGLGAS